MGRLPLVGASAVVGADFKDCRFAAMRFARATLWAVENAPRLHTAAMRRLGYCLLFAFAVPPDGKAVYKQGIYPFFSLQGVFLLF